AVGGWQALQAVLRACDSIARKHGVSIANVATRWVLEQPAVAAVIVGARLGESEHRDDNLQLFSFALDADDLAALNAAFAITRRIPGDCGDEYRKPPFLTASGDLSHHLDALPSLWPAQAMPQRPDRQRVDSGSVWEGIAGYSRAMRVGERIVVSGTTATHGNGRLVGAGDAATQAVYALDKIAASLKSLGSSLDDVIRTRVYLRHADDWRAVSEVHGRVFADVRPANTLLQVAGLIGDGYLVEIEAEAVVGASRSG
ncbi:MAG TPA: aldo/keto reductase, partial [Burkholderiaceae bacterium]|nr:aldo/keto reductase [Burkholderiaceae bacterium]